MLGFQFLATVAARLMGKDADFMPKAKHAGGMRSLDDTEGFFMALAEGQKQHGT